MKVDDAKSWRGERYVDLDYFGLLTPNRVKPTSSASD